MDYFFVTVKCIDSKNSFIVFKNSISLSNLAVLAKTKDNLVDKLEKQNLSI